MKILGIETSCDETSAAIVEDGKTIVCNVVASSAEMHQKYGGIVPEVAARKQLEFMIPVLEETLNCHSRTLSCHSRESGNPDPHFREDDTLKIPDQSLPSTRSRVGDDIKKAIDAIAVTVGPGLIGSLLVGVETAKTLAFTWNKPLIPVNHVLAHPYATFLENSLIYSSTKAEGRIEKIQTDSSRLRSNNNIQFPAIALVVSGGHTELYLMKDEKSMKWIGGTLDDAAGECFDKCARLLGLPYPGGPEISALAENYEPGTQNLELKLPRPMIHDNSLNFSFSGLKTAVLREIKKYTEHHSRDSLCHSRESGNLKDPRVKPEDDVLISAFAFEIQESITDVLVKKTLQAAEKFSAKSIIISGGVAANQRLKEKFNSELLILNSKLSLFVPPPSLCTDSAAYIAAYAFYHNQSVDWRHLKPQPDLEVEIYS